MKTIQQFSKIMLVAMILTCINQQAWSYDVFVVGTGQTVTSSRMPEIKRTVEKISDYYKVTYELDSLVVMDDEEISGAKYFLIPGFSLCQESGRAGTPGKIERFTLDEQSDATLSNIQTSYKEYAMTYSPARLPQINSDDVTPTVTPVNVVAGFYPVSAVSQIESDTYRGKKIFNVGLYPVQYNSQKSKVRIFNRISFLVLPIETDDNLEASTTEFEITEEDLAWHNNVCNLDGVTETVITETVPDNRHYLILSTPALQSASNNLSEWKKSIGYTTSVVVRQSWTTTNVNETIAECLAERPNLYYVILMGDTTHIPTNNARTFIQGQVFKTDVRYACIDGENDFIPDFQIGRIPVTNLSQATSVVSKIINYEKTPFPAGTQAKASFAAHFQTTSANSTTEERGFVYTTENIASYLTDRFEGIERIYSSDVSNPQHWSSRYGNGAHIPDYLDASVFSWDGNSTKIINAFNDGRSFICHRDHGSVSGWSKPSLYTSHLSNLNNSLHPVVLSINCLTGSFCSENSFARSLLNLTNAGCSTVVCASAVSWTQHNDIYLTGMIDSAFPHPGLYYVSNTTSMWNKSRRVARTIGEMMQAGIYRLIELFAPYGENALPAAVRNHIEEYHCLGDPGLPIYYNSSDYLRNHVNTQRSTSGVNISLGTERATVGFHNLTTGESCRFVGSDVTYECAEEDQVQVFVSRWGYKPYSFNSIGMFSENYKDSRYIKSVSGNINNLTVVLNMNNLAEYSGEDLKLYIGIVNQPLLQNQNINFGNDTYTFSNRQGMGAHGIYLLSIVRSDGRILETVKIYL